MFTSTIFGQKH